MKVYISVDFEGVAGSTSWSSTNLGDLEHGPMAREMTLEAAAACRGALAAGATEIYIKDAHGYLPSAKGSKNHIGLEILP